MLSSSQTDFTWKPSGRGLSRSRPSGLSSRALATADTWVSPSQRSRVRVSGIREPSWFRKQSRASTVEITSSSGVSRTSRMFSTCRSRQASSRPLAVIWTEEISGIWARVMAMAPSARVSATPERLSQEADRSTRARSPASSRERREVPAGRVLFSVSSAGPFKSSFISASARARAVSVRSSYRYTVSVRKAPSPAEQVRSASWKQSWQAVRAGSSRRQPVRRRSGRSRTQSPFFTPPPSSPGRASGR